MVGEIKYDSALPCKSIIIFLQHIALISVHDHIRALRINDISPQDSGVSSYVISHPDFNFGHGSSPYPRNGTSTTVYSIFLKTPAAATHVKFSFIKFNIGNYSIAQCETREKNENLQDEFAIYSPLARTLFYCAGGAVSPADRTFNLQNNQLIIQLHIQPTGAVHSGFLIHYQCICK